MACAGIATCFRLAEWAGTLFPVSGTLSAMGAPLADADTVGGTRSFLPAVEGMRA